MTKNDFMVGQTVYLKTVYHPRECWKKERFTTGTVTKVGKKYITVQESPFREYRFNIYNNFRQETQYSLDYQLFLSEQDIKNYWKANYLLFEIAHRLQAFGTRLGVRTLEEIARLMGIPLEPTGTEDKKNG